MFVTVMRINGFWSMRRWMNNCSSECWYAKPIFLLELFGCISTLFPHISWPCKYLNFWHFSVSTLHPVILIFHIKQKVNLQSVIRPALEQVMVVGVFRLLRLNNLILCLQLRQTFQNKSFWSLLYKNKMSNQRKPKFLIISHSSICTASSS